MDALPPEPLSTAVEPVSVAPRTFALTFGATPTQKNWTDRRTVTWPELAEKLTKHEVGPKEGSCIAPAIFEAHVDISLTLNRLTSSCFTRIAGTRWRKSTLRFGRVGGRQSFIQRIHI